MRDTLPANCTLDLLCRHISGGGTVHDLATLWDVSPNLIFDYLGATDESRKRWKEAKVQFTDTVGDRIDAELMCMAFSNVQDLFDKEGNMKPVHLLSKAAARAVQSIEVKHYTEGRGEDAVPVHVTKIKLYDKKQAVELLGRDIGKFRNKELEKIGESLEELIGGSWGKDDPPAAEPTNEPERHQFRTEVDLKPSDDEGPL